MLDPMVTVETSPPPTPPPTSAGRRLGGAVGLVLVLASAVFGSNVNGIRDRVLGSVTPEPDTVAGARVAGTAGATAAAAQTRVRSQPWWQLVTTLRGTSSVTADALTIDDGAIQWRVRWTCKSGRLLVQDPRRTKPLVDASCPGGGDGFSTVAGPVRLAITADGPWELQVQQQVDVPLVEPPLASMTAPGARAVATGKLYRIDQSATGDLTLYRLADGSHALRLEDFFVSPNSDLQLRLSPLTSPTTTKEYLSVPSEIVMPLDITAGSQNFALPPTVDPAKYGSLVVWCPTVTSAYGAATLKWAT